MNFIETALQRGDIYFAIILMSMTYKWTCKDCSHTWEEIKSWKEMSTKCPKCGGKIKQEYTKSKAVWKASLQR